MASIPLAPCTGYKKGGEAHTKRIALVAAAVLGVYGLRRKEMAAAPPPPWQIRARA